MDAEIHSTPMCVCMFTNYQQTQSQWSRSRGPVTKLALQCNATDRQSTQYPNHRVLPFLRFFPWMWVKMEDHSWDHRCECLV